MDGLEDEETALLSPRPPDCILTGYDADYSEEEIKTAWMKVSYAFPRSTLL